VVKKQFATEDRAGAVASAWTKNAARPSGEFMAVKERAKKTKAAKKFKGREDVKKKVRRVEELTSRQSRS